jgi:hypothetical protein
LVCVSCMAKVVEHFFMHLLAICVSSENCSIHSPIYQLNYLFFWCLIFWAIYVLWLLILYLLNSWWRFSSILWLSVDFGNCFPWCADF